MLGQNGCEEPRRGFTVLWGVTTGAVAAVPLWSGGLKALQTLVILVADPFTLVLIAMCVSTLKSLRDEPYESTLPPRVRRAVLHAQRHDRLQHQTIALATLGCDGPDDREASVAGAPTKGKPTAVPSPRGSCSASSDMRPSAWVTTFERQALRNTGSCRCGRCARSTAAFVVVPADSIISGGISSTPVKDESFRTVDGDTPCSTDIWRSHTPG